MKLQWPWVSRKKYEAMLAEATRYDVRIADLAKDNLALVEQLAGIATRRSEALQFILACQTPGANATVRRMARIAREALGR